MTNDRHRTEQQLELLREEVHRLTARVTELEQRTAPPAVRQFAQRGVRRTSSVRVWGIPLYEIAMGPDPVTGQMRGHARALFAFGDIATGVLAFGGLSQGVIAIGGVAVGLVAIGGCAFGVLAGLGGVATGWYSLGGVAMGVRPIGGLPIVL